MRKTNRKLQAEQWCKEHGWTELFEQDGKYYAFRRGAVIPEPIPIQPAFYPPILGLPLKTFLILFIVAVFEMLIGMQIPYYLLENIIPKHTESSLIYIHYQELLKIAPAIIIAGFNLLLSITQGLICILSGSEVVTCLWIRGNNKFLKVVLLVILGSLKVAVLEYFRISFRLNY